MRRECIEGAIKSLGILSNKTFADVEAERFDQLRNEFSGTIIYWEVE